MLSIDIIEHCNFSCYFCGAKDLPERSYMDFDFYTHIIDQAVDLGFTAITLTPLTGEPFLHPRIYDILRYSVARLKLVTLDTNATAIDVARLKEIDRTNLRIKISQYGNNAEEFVQLTNSSPRLWNTFCQKIADLTEAKIDFTIRMRELDHRFKYETTNEQFALQDINTKCKFHMVPQIFSNGDVTFCRFFRDGFEGANWKSLAPYANLHTMSLADVMTHPLRYKFYDSQSMCAAFCRTSYCAGDVATLNSYKMMSLAKQNYKKCSDVIDERYDQIEQTLAVNNPRP